MERLTEAKGVTAETEGQRAAAAERGGLFLAVSVGGVPEGCYPFGKY